MAEGGRKRNQLRCGGSMRRESSMPVPRSRFRHVPSGVLLRPELELDGAAVSITLIRGEFHDESPTEACARIEKAATSSQSVRFGTERGQEPRRKPARRRRSV